MTSPSFPRTRLRAALTAAGTLLIALTLLAGMPWILWQAVGFPWPEHVTSWHDFTDRLAEPVSDPMMIELLALIGWACWAAFASSATREALWYATHLPQLIRDRHAHHEHLAGLTLRRSLAALCIGTFVVALLSIWRPHPHGMPQSAAYGESAPSQAVVAAPLRLAAAQVPEPGTSTEPQTPGGQLLPGPLREQPQTEHTVVEGDTLWDLADTYLGDALKWPRIYAANKQLVQGDGAALTDPDRITPGWKLTIPATGSIPPSRRTSSAGQRPNAPHNTPAAEMPTPAGTIRPGLNHGIHPHKGPLHKQPEKPPATERKDQSLPGPATVDLGTASLIGITTAAGLLAARRYWYWHKNRDRGDESNDLPALSPLIDRAAQAAHAATQPAPEPDPDALITRRTPPQKPSHPGAVTIGVRDNTEVPLEELATPGGITWTGPGADAVTRALLIGILTAAERTRPGPAHTTAVIPRALAERLLPGLPTQFTALTQSRDLTQAIQLAEHHLIAHARARDEHESASEPLTDNVSTPGTLLLITVPDAAHTAQLHALAARSDATTLIVLNLDAALPAAATWHIAQNGTTTTPEGTKSGTHPLQLFHLTPEAARRVTDVILTAHGQRRRLRVLPNPTNLAEPQETDISDELEEEEHPRHPPSQTAEPPQSPTPTKPVRIHVLGPVTLYARGHEGPIGTNLRSEAREFLALLAAHPTGLLSHDIADKLHIKTGTEQNALKNLRRAVRRTLRAATGITTEEFILLQGELHKLHPDLVETDLADFTRHVKDAFAAPAHAPASSALLPALRDALNHYRGPFAQGTDYLWADAIRENASTQAIDAAIRLARATEQTGAEPPNRDAVLDLLERLCTLHPDRERLAQHTIRLYQAAHRHDAARCVYDRLNRQLTDIGLKPNPGTQVLIAPRAAARQSQ